MIYLLIAVICAQSWGMSCNNYELRTFDKFSTMEECQEASKALKGSGIAIRYYCKREAHNAMTLKQLDL